MFDILIYFLEMLFDCNAKDICLGILLLKADITSKYVQVDFISSIQGLDDS